MKYICILFSFFFTINFPLLAQSENFRNYQKITLNDGSIIDGFLKSQDILNSVNSKPKVEVYVRSVERMIADTLVTSTYSTAKQKLTDLEYWWQDWFVLNHQYVEKKNNTEQVSLDEIVLKSDVKMPIWGDIPQKVKILESGVCTRFLEFPMKTYVLDASMISKIEYPEISDSISSGIEEIITTKDNKTYVGYITYIIPGKRIGISLKDDIYHVVNVDLRQISKRDRVGKNSVQKILNQSPFIEIIEPLKEDIQKGIITCYHYDDNIENSYINLLNLNNEVKNIPFKKIVKISQEENFDYHPLKNIRIADDDILVNGKRGTFLESLIKDEQNIIKNDSNAMNISYKDSKGKLVLHFKKNSEYKDLTLLRVKKSQFKKRDIEKMGIGEKIKDIWIKTNYVDLYSFYFSEVVKNKIPYIEEVCPNDVIQRTYKGLKGSFVLYSPFKNKFILLHVK